MLFVDGNIVGNTDAIFHITQSFPLNVVGIPDETFVNDAVLQIIDSNRNVSEPAISLGRGKYQIWIGELDANVRYGIRIEHNGDIFESALSRPLRTPEVNVRWRQYESLGAIYFYISTHDETDEAKFFLWHYAEDWEVRTWFSNPPFSQCWRRNTGFELGTTEALTENSIIDRQILRIEPEGDRFFFNYGFTVTQTAISQGAFEFHQNMKIQNEEMGGIFTPQPAEVLGNIRSITNPQRRVMGYVNTVKNTSRQRIFLTRGNVRWPILDWCRERNNSCHLFGLTPAEAWWLPADCWDCRAMGGVPERPYFMPNIFYEPALGLCPPMAPPTQPLAR